MNAIKWVCDRTTFRPVDFGKVRWLDWDKDFSLVREFKPFPLSREHWERARDEGYCYCLMVEDGKIASWAGEKRSSEEAREVVEVETLPTLRKKGYGKAVLSFVTAHILEVSRVAICETSDDNLAMIHTAESIGYKMAEPGAAANSHP